MPKGRAAVAISTGHGSFHLGDRTESRNECKHSISEVFAKSIGSSPGPSRSASGSAARSNLCNSPPGTAKLWCGQSGMGAESFGFVGTVAQGNSTADHLENTYSFFKDIDMKRAEESSALIRRAYQLHPLEFRLGHRATPAKLSRPNRPGKLTPVLYVSGLSRRAGEGSMPVAEAPQKVPAGHWISPANPT